MFDQIVFDRLTNTHINVIGSSRLSHRQTTSIAIRRDSFGMVELTIVGLNVHKPCSYIVSAFLLCAVAVTLGFVDSPRNDSVLSRVIFFKNKTFLIKTKKIEILLVTICYRQTNKMSTYTIVVELILFVTAAVAAPINSNASQCPSDAVYGEAFDKCYYYNSRMMNYFQVNPYCDMLGGRLVSIHSSFENNFVVGKYFLMLTLSTS